jgi:hypothetical protein
MRREELPIPSMLPMLPLLPLRLPPPNFVGSSRRSSPCDAVTVHVVLVNL